MITYQELKAASHLFMSLEKIKSYITKERFEMAAKCEFNITDKKPIERMFGLFCEVPNNMYRIACHDEEIKDELTTALHIAQTAYENVEINNVMLPKLEEGYLYEKDKRRYFYRVGEDGAIQELDVNLDTPFGIITFGNLLKRDDVKVTGVTHFRGKIERNNSQVEYYEGDIVFVWGDPTDRIFFSWYNSDAGVYLSTDRGWKKLLYTPGRGYLDKNKEPDFETDDCFSDYKISKSGNGFKIMGNIHKDLSVLMERKGGEK